jgi:hypothetical protein
MVSRRVVLGSGLVVLAGGAVVRLAGRDDDLLRALGARPRPVPDPSDTALLRTAAEEQAALLASVEQLDDVDDLVAVLREQLEALGGATAATPAPATGTPDDVARLVAAAARRREADALAATSPDLGRVLASLAAGQAQVARTLGRRAAR